MSTVKVLELELGKRWMVLFLETYKYIRKQQSFNKIIFACYIIICNILLNRFLEVVQS